MKKLFLLLIVAVTFMACGNDDDKKSTVYDSTAMITLRASSLKSSLSGDSVLTGLQVVQKALNLKWTSHYFDNQYYDDAKLVGRSFPSDYKDFTIPALKMLPYDVITDQGVYYRDMTYAYEVVVTDSVGDTIAYVPKSVIESARIKIEAAYDAQNYEEVYNLFNTAFVFIPTNNKLYRELKTKGEN